MLFGFLALPGGIVDPDDWLRTESEITDNSSLPTFAG